MLISSSGEPLNKAHARYLEYRLYMRATQVAKVTLGNSQSPTESKLSDAARAHMNDFLENIYLFLPALRFDLFTQNAKPQAPAVLAPVMPLVHFVFEVPKNGIKARAHIDEGDFVVEAGSLARRKWEGAVHATYMPLHQELLDQGILGDNGQHAIFTQSFGFSSASAAAAVVAGRPASGPKSWIVEGTGQSLGDLEAKSLGEKTGTDFVE